MKIQFICIFLAISTVLSVEPVSTIISSDETASNTGFKLERLLSKYFDSF